MGKRKGREANFLEGKCSEKVCLFMWRKSQKKAVDQEEAAVWVSKKVEDDSRPMELMAKARLQLLYAQRPTSPWQHLTPFSVLVGEVRTIPPPSWLLAQSVGRASVTASCVTRGYRSREVRGTTFVFFSLLTHFSPSNPFAFRRSVLLFRVCTAKQPQP